MTAALLSWLWLAGVNALTVLAFRVDKRIAQEGGRRVSEANLLMLAMAGGSLGALFARQKFRHKTRKQPFSTILIAIAVVQLAALALFLLSRS